MANKDIIESVWNEYDNLMGLHLDRIEEIEFNDHYYYFNHYDKDFGWDEQEEGEERAFHDCLKLLFGKNQRLFTFE